MQETDVFVQAPPPPRIIYEYEPFWSMLDPGQLMIVIVLAIAAFTIVFWPIMRALGKRLEGRSGSDAELREMRAELDALRSHVADLACGLGRVAELEEPVDFAERLLTQREPARVEAGRHE